MARWLRPTSAVQTFPLRTNPREGWRGFSRNGRNCLSASARTSSGRFRSHSQNDGRAKERMRLLQRPEITAINLLVDVGQHLHSGAAIGKVAADLFVPCFVISIDKPREESLAVVGSEFTNRRLDLARRSAMIAFLFPQITPAVCSLRGPASSSFASTCEAGEDVGMHPASGVIPTYRGSAFAFMLRQNSWISGETVWGVRAIMSRP